MNKLSRFDQTLSALSVHDAQSIAYPYRLSSFPHLTHLKNGSPNKYCIVKGDAIG